MIRRLGDAIAHQDWFVVLIELVVLVVGIFIGLQAMNPGGLSASQLRTELQPQVSQPTLWRRLDELRAKGRVRRSGRGRATRCYGVDSDHTISDLRAKALHLEVGKKLLRQQGLLR